MKSICVFCGSSSGKTGSPYQESARQMGAAIARQGLDLVYGGGGTGLMRAVADAVMAGGGHVIGVIPRAMTTSEVAHPGLPDLRVVGSMHERKALMAELSDAFIALPGGLGTLEEFAEILTWAQLGIHQKPCGLLNVQGYYDHLLAYFDHAMAEDFIPPVHRSLVLQDQDPDNLLSRLATYQPPPLHRWIEREET